MNTRRVIQIGCAVVLGLAMYIPGAHADARDEQAFFTFSEPVQISNTVVLPAGRYTFRLADMLSYRNNVLQVYDDNGNFITSVVTEVTNRTTTTPWNNNLLIKTTLEFAQGTDHFTLVKYFYEDNTEGHKLTYSARQERALSEEPHLTVMPAPENRAPNSLLASNYNR